MLRCQMSSDVDTLISPATPSFLNSCAAPVGFCRTLWPRTMARIALWATTVSQNWRQVIERYSLCNTIGSGPERPKSQTRQISFEFKALAFRKTAVSRYSELASFRGDRLRAKIREMAGIGKCVYARYLPRAQRLLQPLPVFDTHEIRMRGPEPATQPAAAHPQARFDLLRQKGHARLEEPGGNVLLAVAAIAVGPYLHVGQRFHGVVIVEVDLEVTAHAVVAGIEVLVEDVRRRVIADTKSQVDHRPLGLVRGRG